MKIWKIRFTPQSALLISKLHPDIKKQIKPALVELRQNPHVGKDLQEELVGFRSLRFKQYRIIDNINEEKKIIQIFHIGQRKDVYEQFRRLLIELQKS